MASYIGALFLAACCTNLIGAKERQDWKPEGGKKNERQQIYLLEHTTVMFLFLLLMCQETLSLYLIILIWR